MEISLEVVGRQRASIQPSGSAAKSGHPVMRQSGNVDDIDLECFDFVLSIAGCYVAGKQGGQ